MSTPEQTILAAIQEHQWASRISTKLSETVWRQAINSLLSQGKVVKHGEKRGTLYTFPEQQPPPKAPKQKPLKSMRKKTPLPLEEAVAIIQELLKEHSILRRSDTSLTTQEWFAAVHQLSTEGLVEVRRAALYRLPRPRQTAVRTYTSKAKDSAAVQVLLGILSVSQVVCYRTSGLPHGEWIAAIRYLVDSGQVIRQGSRKNAVYRLTEAVTDEFSANEQKVMDFVLANPYHYVAVGDRDALNMPVRTILDTVALLVHKGHLQPNGSKRYRCYVLTGLAVPENTPYLQHLANLRREARVKESIGGKRGEAMQACAIPALKDRVPEAPEDPYEDTYSDEDYEGEDFDFDATDDVT